MARGGVWLGEGRSPPPAGNALIGDPSLLVSDGPTTLARRDVKGPALSLSVVLEQFFRLIPPERCRHPFLSRSEEHTSELQSQSNLVCRLLLEKKKKKEK